MNGRRFDAFIAQLMFEVIGIALRLDENQRQSFALGQDLQQTIQLVALATSGGLNLRQGKTTRRTEGGEVTSEEDETGHCTGSDNKERAM
jgi:hypothetical protein